MHFRGIFFKLNELNYFYPRYFDEISCKIIHLLSIFEDQKKDHTIYHLDFLGVVSKVDNFYYWTQWEFVGNAPNLKTFYKIFSFKC